MALPASNPDLILTVDRDGSYIFYSRRPIAIRVVDHGMCNDVASCDDPDDNPILVDYIEEECDSQLFAAKGLLVTEPFDPYGNTHY